MNNTNLLDSNYVVDFLYALRWCKEVASAHGLEYEVVQTYRGFVRDQKLTRAEYMQHASDALYEWDI
jgi:hypothetical protein